MIWLHRIGLQIVFKCEIVNGILIKTKIETSFIFIVNRYFFQISNPNKNIDVLLTIYQVGCESSGLNEIKTEQVNEILIVVDWLKHSFRNILCQNCIEFHLLIVSNWPYSVCVVLTTNPNILAFGSCYVQSNTTSNILRQQITDGFDRETESGREQKRKKAPVVKRFEKKTFD